MGFGTGDYYTNSQETRVLKPAEDRRSNKDPGISGSYSHNNSYNTAQNIATQNNDQGSLAFPNAVGGGIDIRALIEQLRANLSGFKPPEIPQQKGFGFDLPTINMAGDVVGNFGKLFSGIGALKTAGYAGDVLQANAGIMDDNAYRTAQGMTNLADLIKA
jgi:hypothetical protein